MVLDAIYMYNDVDQPKMTLEELHHKTKEMKRELETHRTRSRSALALDAIHISKDVDQPKMSLEELHHKPTIAEAKRRDNLKQQLRQKKTYRCRLHLVCRCGRN